MEVAGQPRTDRLVANGREDRRVDGEDNHQQQCQHIGGDRNAAHGQHHGQPVDDAARPAGAEHCQRHRYHQSDDQRVDHEFERDREALAQDRRHRLRARKRDAEVAMDRAAEPVAVATPQPLVEVQLDAEGTELGGRGVDAEQRLGRVAGQGVEGHECQESDAPQHRNGRQQPTAAEPQGRGPGQAAQDRAAWPASRLDRNCCVHVSSDVSLIRCWTRTARGPPGSRRCSELRQ